MQAIYDAFANFSLSSVLGDKDRSHFYTSMDEALNVDDQLWSGDALTLPYTGPEEQLWLVHIALKSEWGEQPHEYVPDGQIGVPLIELNRLSELVRRDWFTKNRTKNERYTAWQRSGTFQGELCYDTDTILVFIPFDNNDVVRKGERQYPFLERPLDKSSDAYVTCALAFNLEKMTCVVPTDDDIQQSLDEQRYKRAVIKRQEAQ